MYATVLNWRTRSKHRELARLSTDEATRAQQSSSSAVVVDVDGALHPVKLPNNAEELAFLAELHALEKQVAELQDELRDL